MIEHDSLVAKQLLHDWLHPGTIIDGMCSLLISVDWPLTAEALCFKVAYVSECYFGLLHCDYLWAHHDGHGVCINNGGMYVYG